MKDNRMDNIVECAYNMDNGYVEVWFTDGNMLRIKCEEVEAALRTTEQSLAKLHRLLDSKPIEYVVMALSGEMQAYLNRDICQPEGFDAYGYPSELFKLDMERLGIVAKRKPAKVIDFAQYIENNRGTNH